MPRNKPTPKRRRVEEEEKEKEALDELKKTPAEIVEAAAAEAFGHAIEHWPALEGDAVPEWLSGLGVVTEIPDNHLAALQSLHVLIKDKASGFWSSWSGDPKDPRRRAFGLGFPDTLGSEEEVRSQLDISMPWAEQDNGKASEEERTKNQQATVIVDQLPNGVKEAVDWITINLQKNIQDPSIRAFLTYSALVAAQPNLHSGRQLLPIHVDHPQKDGFGVVIVTVAIVGNATILFQDHSDKKKAKLKLEQGQAYMISGNARDACAHGVLADKDSYQRESLNLRFGLHDLAFTPEQPFSTIPSSNVLKHWELEDSRERNIVPDRKKEADNRWTS